LSEFVPFNDLKLKCPEDNNGKHQDKDTEDPYNAQGQPSFRGRPSHFMNIT
jgi:hypothetical protein